MRGGGSLAGGGPHLITHEFVGRWLALPAACHEFVGGWWELPAAGDAPTGGWVAVPAAWSTPRRYYTSSDSETAHLAPHVCTNDDTMMHAS